MSAKEKLFLRSTGSRFERTLTVEGWFVPTRMVCIFNSAGAEHDPVAFDQGLCIHHAWPGATKTAVSPGHLFFLDDLDIGGADAHPVGKVADRQGNNAAVFRLGLFSHGIMAVVTGRQNKDQHQ